jgi:serine protease
VPRTAGPAPISYMEPRSYIRDLVIATACALLAFAIGAPLASAAGRGSARATRAAPRYAPRELIVGYRPPVRSPLAEIRTIGRLPEARAVRGTTATAAAPASELIRLPRGASVTAAARAFARLPGVSYAVPNYVARAAGSWIPNDPGRTHHAGGWRRLQWNFLAKAGVNAPEAWANLRHDHRAGGKGVVVAVLDTGVAFRDWKKFKRSPDFAGTRFVDPCDLVAGTLEHGRCTDPYPLDRNGHGTFVTGVIAEATNNHLGLTGLAYGASIMPVRVLDASGDGYASVISRGIRYAVSHGAAVINLSLEFDLDVRASGIPTIISAIRFAHAHGVVVVAAAGNDSSTQIAYPAHAPQAVSVGATTLDRCLANYSNVGSGLDLVAPGGGEDTRLTSGAGCHPNRRLPDVFQMTFGNPSRPTAFGFPGGWYGTSMSAPDVSAAAALVIASRVLGRHPTPDQILARLEQTAQPLGGSAPNSDYGYGLLNVGAATSRHTGTTPTTTTPTTTTPTTTTPTTTTPAPTVVVGAVRSS